MLWLSDYPNTARYILIYNGEEKGTDYDGGPHRIYGPKEY